MSGQLVIGEFDVSGLTVDTRTGKVGGNWIELAEGAATRLDHQTVAELCRCCGVELLRSGSKWSVWFCKECKARVEGLNRNAGACVVPIGRHTLMHGVGVRGPDAVHDPSLVKAFAIAANDIMGKQKRLSEWAAEIVKRNCASCALIAEKPIPISTYLDGVASQSRQLAFDAMCEWWRGLREPCEAQTSAERRVQHTSSHTLDSSPRASQAQSTRIVYRSPQGESTIHPVIQKVIVTLGWLLMAAILAGIASQASTDTSNRVMLVCLGLVVCRLSRDTFAETRSPWKTVANVSFAISIAAVLAGSLVPRRLSGLERAVLQWCQANEVTLDRITIPERLLHEAGEAGELAEQCDIIQNRGPSFNDDAMFYAVLIFGVPALVGALLSEHRFKKFDARLREREQPDF